MAMIINTNLASLDAQRNTAMSSASLQTSMQRLSSGLRINSAKDDAAGLGIATRMGSQVQGMTVAEQNANDAISMSQTADGALSSLTDDLQRMRELAVEASNGTNSGSDQDSLDQEFGQLANEVQRVIGGTTFNNLHLLASDAGTVAFQVGANTTVDDQITITTDNLAVDSTITAVAGTDQIGTGRANINSTTTGAALATVINNIDAALTTINSQRAIQGAAQSRFSAVVSNLQTSVENQTAAQSRIMDADFAAETANLSRSQILQQAGTAMIAQANQQPQGVLKLLQ